MKLVDLFHDFFLKKIIYIIPKVAGALEFYKNTPKLFQNYLVVPKFLHLDP
jgi:hypothetical protein